MGKTFPLTNIETFKPNLLTYPDKTRSAITPDFPDGQVTRSLPTLWCEPEAKATKIHKCYKQPIGMRPKLDILPTSSDYLCRCDIIFQALCETPGG